MTIDWSQTQRTGLAMAGVWLAIAGLCFAQGGEARSESYPPADAEFAIWVSQDLINEYLVGEVRRESTIQDVVLGARVNGRASTRGRLTVDFAHSSREAAFSMVLVGNTTAETTARQGPARINTTTQTRFSARRDVIFDGQQGVRAAEPVVAAECNRRVRGVRSTLPGLRGWVVRRAAWKRLGQQSNYLDTSARTKAEQRITASFDAGTEVPLARLNRLIYLVSPAVEEYRRVGKYQMELCTFHDSLCFSLRPKPSTTSLEDGERPRFLAFTSRAAPSGRRGLLEAWVKVRDDRPTNGERKLWASLAKLSLELLQEWRAEQDAPLADGDLAWEVHQQPGYLTAVLAPVEGEGGERVKSEEARIENGVAERRGAALLSPSPGRKPRNHSPQ